MPKGRHWAVECTANCCYWWAVHTALSTKLRWTQAARLGRQTHTCICSPSSELLVFLASCYNDYESLINWTKTQLLTSQEIYNQVFVKAVGHAQQLGSILKGKINDSSAARKWTLNQVKTAGRAEQREHRCWKWTDVEGDKVFRGRAPILICNCDL